MDPFLTPTQLKKLRVVDLKEKLAALGLPLNGLKADLIKRLSDYYASQQKLEVAEPVVAQEPAPPPTIPSMEMIDASDKQTGQDTVNTEELDRVKEGEQNYEAPHEISHQEEEPVPQPAFPSMEMIDVNKQAEQDTLNTEELDRSKESEQMYEAPHEMSHQEEEPVPPATFPSMEMIDISKRAEQDTLGTEELDRVKEGEQTYAPREITNQEEGPEPSFPSMEMDDVSKQTDQGSINPEQNDGIKEDTETYETPSEISHQDKEPVPLSMEMIDTSAKTTEQDSSNPEEFDHEKEDGQTYETTQPVSHEEKEPVSPLPFPSTEVIDTSTNQTEMSTLDSEEIDREKESEQTFETPHTISDHEKEKAPSPPIPSVETIDVSSKQSEEDSSNTEEKGRMKEGEQSHGTPQEISDLENLLTEALQAKQSQSEVDYVDADDTSKIHKQASDFSKAETKNVTSSNEISESAQQQKKLSRNEKKKLRKKKKKIEKQKSHPNEVKKATNELDDDDDLDIEYIEDEVPKDPIYYQYVKVFEKFKTTGSEDLENLKNDNEIVDPAKKMLERKKPVELELKEDDEKNDGEPKLSKRKLKQLTRMTVADLKQKVSHPELVEMHDVTARDPLLLLHLKSTRNSVPVPRHWCYKRKYLQGKRGFEKPAFKLPDFIRKTGIMEMRQALQEKEDAKSLKTRQREKIRPKLGKIDIDYQKLHDAFFKCCIGNANWP
uniref:SAP domain-containing protein n=1 Tax=Tetranychus urticae TaxID=32264 RepID=T1JTC2_TETUR